MSKAWFMIMIINSNIQTFIVRVWKCTDFSVFGYRNKSTYIYMYVSRDQFFLFLRWCGRYSPNWISPTLLSLTSSFSDPEDLPCQNPSPGTTLEHWPCSSLDWQTLWWWSPVSSNLRPSPPNSPSGIIIFCGITCANVSSSHFQLLKLLPNFNKNL